MTDVLIVTVEYADEGGLDALITEIESSGAAGIDAAITVEVQ